MEYKDMITPAQLSVCSALIEPDIADVMRRLLIFDKTTFQHSLNVAYLAAQIMEMSKKEIANGAAVIKGALLHDIGKITIGRDIIQKPGKLTAEEYELIKTHPEKGLCLLHELTNIHDPVIEQIVLYHHERPDGTGYPAHLKADSIPWYVRLINSVDVYDAMIADRPYNTLCSRSDALDTLWHEHLDQSSIRALTKYLIN